MATKRRIVKMSVEPPRLAAWLMITGGVIVIISAILWVIITNAATSLPLPPNANATERAIQPIIVSATVFAEELGIVSILFGLIMMLAGYKILNSTVLRQIRIWSAVALVASLLSLVSFGGFIIGMGMGVLGSIIGFLAKEY